MNIAVKLFGPQSQIAGTSELRINLEGASPTVADLRCAVAAAEPKLAPGLSNSRLAVNFEFAGDDQPVQSDDEVALIGMVCGG